MSDVKQIGIVGNAIHTSRLPEADAFTYGDGNRFYTLENYQEGYSSGHTYRTVIEKDSYVWKDVDSGGAADGDAALNFLTKKITGVLNDKNGEVTYISAMSLYGQNLEEIYLPAVKDVGNSVISISASGSAFAGCTKARVISLPALTNIYGFYNFARCFALESMILPYVTSIPMYTFAHCSNISYIEAPNVVSVSSIGSSAFNGCFSLKSFVWGGKWTSVPQYCFQNCSSLERVDFASDAHLYIANYAFAYANIKEGLDISTTSDVRIAPYAFGSCALSKINITTTSLYIESNAFNGCQSLESIYISHIGSSNITFGSSAFVYCTNLKWGRLSESPIHNIYSSCFYGCSNIEYAYLPEVRYIYDMAFGYCKKLSYVYAPKLKQFGSYRIFYSAYSLRSIYIMQESGLTESDVPTCKGSTFISTANNAAVYVGYSEYLPWIRAATNWTYISNRIGVSLFVNPDESTE